MPSGSGVELALAFAARELFLEHGHTDVTVEAICERVGTSTRTFYRHFRTKEDVVVPLFATWYAAVEADLRTVPPGSDVVLELARLLATSNYQRPSSHRFLSILQAHPEYRRRWRSVDDRLADAFAECLVEHGRVPPGFEAELAAQLVVHAAHVAYLHWLAGPEDAATLLDTMGGAMRMAVGHWPPRPARVPAATGPGAG